MRNVGMPLLAAVLIFLACGSNDNNGNEKHDEGSEQVQGPVLNSGPETERDRANDAVRDTTLTNDKDSSKR